MAEFTEELRRAYAGFGAGDMDAVLSVMGPGIEWDASDALAHKGIYRGHDGVREYIGGISSHWDAYELAPDEFTESGDHVMVLGYVRGRLKGSPETMELRFAHVVEIADGKIVRLKVCLDREAAGNVLESAGSAGA